MSQHRSIIRVTGADRESFLQGLVTNDVRKLDSGLVYAALLTAQGKYVSDFFLVPEGDAILIDAARTHAPTLIQRLGLYRLRADVRIDLTDRQVALGLGATPEGAFADPRHPDLGWRAYDGRASQEGVDWDALRVRLAVPEPESELTADSYILEMGFERLNGVDFRKGCYVGQEVTARMKHKTELRKGLARVHIDGRAVTGDDIRAGDRVAGQVLTVSGQEALAYLRFDRAGNALHTRGGDVTLITP